MRIPFEYSVVGQRKGRRSVQLHHTRSTVDVEVRDLTDVASGPLDVFPDPGRRIADGRIWTPVKGLNWEDVGSSNHDAFVDELLRVNAIDRLIGPRNAFLIRSMSHFDSTDRKKAFEPAGTEFRSVRSDDREVRSTLATDGADLLAWIDGTLHSSTHLPVLRLSRVEGVRDRTSFVDMQRLVHLPGRDGDVRPSVSLREMRRLHDEGALPDPAMRATGPEWQDLARMLDDEGVEQELPTLELGARSIHSQIADLVAPRGAGSGIFGEGDLAIADVPEDLDDALLASRRLVREIDRRLDLRLDASELVRPLERACTSALEILHDLCSLRRPDATRWRNVTHRSLDDVSFGLDVLRARLALTPRATPTRIRDEDHGALEGFVA